MRNAGLDKTQDGIKIAGRNVNNLTYVDDTTHMAKSKEDLKSLLMKGKEENENIELKLNIQKKIMASSFFISWQTDRETMETVRAFIFLGTKIRADGDYSHEIKRHQLLKRKAMTNLDSISKSRHYFANKGPLRQSYGLSSSHVQMWELHYRKEESGRIEDFQLWCWKRFLSPLYCRRSNQSILKEISPGYSLQRQMLKLKL